MKLLIILLSTSILTFGSSNFGTIHFQAECSAYGTFFDTNIYEAFDATYSNYPSGDYDWSIVNSHHTPYTKSMIDTSVGGYVYTKYEIASMAKDAEVGELFLLGKAKHNTYDHILNDKPKDDYIEKIQIAPGELEAALSQCSSQINKDKNALNKEYFGILFGIIVGLIIAFLLLKKIFKISKDNAPIAAKKYKDTVKKHKEEKHAKKVRDIAEEESIKASIKKSINNSDEVELEDLQDVINDALSKGDTATAQALLKILNKNKK